MSLDEAAAYDIARRMIAGQLARPTWREWPHWWDERDPERTARYVLLLDALNFSFWGEPRWRVTLRGETVDGYRALAAALRRALDNGEPLLETEYLATRARAEDILAGDGGTPIPLLTARQAALREVGEGLLASGGFLPLLNQAGGRVGPLVTLIAEHFPSFRDVATHDGRPVPFYKRAQIVVADLWGAFEGEGPGSFADMDALTMFADYKVPQVLHGLGALRYSGELTASLAAREPIPPNDGREVEIRAASVQAVERIVDCSHALGQPLAAFDVDWRLWMLGQGTTWPLPYHLTQTVAY